MKSKLRQGNLLHALRGTVSLRGKDGNTYRILKSVTRLLPSGMPLVTAVDQRGRKKAVLLESDFRRFLQHKGTIASWLAKSGVSRTQWYRMLNVYGHKYAHELKEHARQNYSLALKGNKYGARDRPSVLLDHEELEQCLERGLGVYQIAEALDTTAFIVRSNLRHYSLCENKNTPVLRRFSHLPQSYVDLLELFNPGLAEAAKNFHRNKRGFFDRLYRVYIRILDLKYAVKELQKSHSHFVSTGEVPRNHVCWADNRHEALLSAELLREGIEHMRGVKVGKYYVDFILGMLAVEIDGSFHEKDTETQERDKRKIRLLRRRGYKVLRFSTKDVEKDTSMCVAKIRSLLKM